MRPYLIVNPAAVLGSKPLPLARGLRGHWTLASRARPTRRLQFKVFSLGVASYGVLPQRRPSIQWGACTCGKALDLMGYILSFGRLQQISSNPEPEFFWLHGPVPQPMNPKAYDGGTQSAQLLYSIYLY